MMVFSEFCETFQQINKAKSDLGNCQICSVRSGDLMVCSITLHRYIFIHIFIKFIMLQFCIIHVIILIYLYYYIYIYNTIYYIYIYIFTPLIHKICKSGYFFRWYIVHIYHAEVSIIQS